MSNLIFLFFFGVTDYPHKFYDCFTLEEKQAIVALAARNNICFPNKEVIEYNGFEPTLFILRMRYNGTPLPYPADPILGQRVPEFSIYDYWKMWELGLVP